jgi:propanol-preferring alcohol dehydrogenase
VLVRIGGAGACHSDLHLMHELPEGLVPWTLPFTLGHENAGWIEAVGAGVTGLESGQPVAVYGAWGCGRCPRCAAGAENYCDRRSPADEGGCGLGLDGGMAPYLLVPQSRWLVPLGDLDPVTAAPLTDAGLTPYHAVKRSLGLLVPGSTAVIIGVGGLGHLAVQILRAVCAAKVIAVDTRPAARASALAAGADHAVEAGATAAAEVRDLTGGRGAEVVIDLVGSDATLALAAAVSRPLGHLTCVGIAGGTLPFNYFGLPQEVSVASTYWGSRPELAEVIALAEAGHLRPEIHRFALDEAPEAYRRLHAGDLTGRAVVVP